MKVQLVFEKEEYSFHFTSIPLVNDVICYDKCYQVIRAVASKAKESQIFLKEIDQEIEHFASSINWNNNLIQGISYYFTADQIVFQNVFYFLNVVNKEKLPKTKIPINNFPLQIFRKHVPFKHKSNYIRNYRSYFDHEIIENSDEKLYHIQFVEMLSERPVDDLQNKNSTTMQLCKKS